MVFRSFPVWGRLFIFFHAAEFFSFSDLNCARDISGCRRVCAAGQIAPPEKIVVRKD